MAPRFTQPLQWLARTIPCAIEQGRNSADQGKNCPDQGNRSAGKAEEPFLRQPVERKLDRGEALEREFGRLGPVENGGLDARRETGEVQDPREVALGEAVSEDLGLRRGRGLTSVLG